MTAEDGHTVHVLHRPRNETKGHAAAWRQCDAQNNGEKTTRASNPTTHLEESELELREKHREENRHARCGHEIQRQCRDDSC
eukprot:SAG22_NODE_14276_length_379_cov_1.039286_1_plen_81_part_10